MKVPVLDLQSQYRALEGEVDAALKRVCENSWFKLGPEVEKFERDWAEYCDAARCVAVNSGTRPCTCSCAPTASAPATRSSPAPDLLRHHRGDRAVGATPVFVDIDPSNF